MRILDKLIKPEHKDSKNTAETKKPIIIVSGLPRSGTSMMMKILATGGFDVVSDSIREADDDHPKGYYELEDVKALGGEIEPEWIKSAPGKVVKIISFLLQHLPSSYNYKVIFMKRDITEILASQSKMLERRGETSTDSEEKVAETFNEHLKRVKIWLANQPNFDVFYVDHRVLMKDPRVIVSQLVKFVGTALSEDTLEKMASVPDPSLYRNRND